jgi:mannitol operon transcriptional antiterminator
MEDGRIARILSTLLDCDGFVSCNRLAGRVDSSVATVFRTIRRAEAKVASFGLSIERKRGMGLRLAGSRDAREKLRVFLKNAQFSPQFSMTDRKALVLLHIFANRSGTKLLSLSHSLALSESSISKCMNELAAELDAVGLTIERRPGIGTQLVGEERALCSAAFRSIMSVIDRNALLSVLLHRLGRSKVPPSDFGSTTYQLVSFMEKTVSIEALVDAVERFESNLDWPMSDSTYLSVAIVTWLVALRGGAILGEFQESEDILPESEFLRPILEHVVGRSPSNRQCNLVYASVAALAALDAPCVSKGQRALADRVVRLFEAGLGVEATPREDVVELLARHIVSLGLQFRHGILLTGSFPGHQYATAHRERLLLSDVANLLSSRLGSPVSAIHAQLLLDSIRPALTERIRPVRTVVVCAAGVGTSYFLSKNISDRVMGVDVVAVVSVRAATDEFLRRNRIELIVSTVETSFASVPTVRIRLPLSDTGIAQIQHIAQTVRRDLSHGSGHVNACSKEETNVIRYVESPKTFEDERHKTANIGGNNG